MTVCYETLVEGVLSNSHEVSYIMIKNNYTLSSIKSKRKGGFIETITLNVNSTYFKSAIAVYFPLPSCYLKLLDYVNNKEHPVCHIFPKKVDF